MQHQTRKQDAFQSELNDALRKRRVMEGIGPKLVEETESDTDSEEDESYQYDDDFSQDSTDIYVTSKKDEARPSNQSKYDDDWDLPSFLKDEETNVSGGRDFLLHKEQKKTPSKTVFDPLGMGMMDKTHSFKLEQDSTEDEDDLSLLKLLKGDRTNEENKPTPAKRADQKSYHSKLSKSPLQSSPPTSEYQKSYLSREGRESPSRGHRSPDFLSKHSVDPRKSPDITKHSQELKGQVRTTRPKTPVSGKESPVLQGILDTMKSNEAPDILRTDSQRQQRKKDKPEGFVDFLLDASQPKPAPRKKGSKSSSLDSESVKSPTTRSLSPSSHAEEKSFGQKKQRLLSGERENRQHSLSNRPLSPGIGKQLYSSVPSSSLQLRERSITAPSENTRAKVSSVLGTEREKSNSDADDLLALFNQAMGNDNMDFQAHIQQKQERNKIKTPLEEVLHKTTEQNEQAISKQRSSRQLLDNVIDNVAQHNDGSESSVSTARGDKIKVSTPRKKSYRIPPKDYQGLGSLTMLKELKKGNATMKDNNETDVSSDDIRKRIYLEWLAKREEEAKKKRREEQEKEKIEKEKLKKEREEKELENTLVRKKWEDVKKEQLKEKAKGHRIEEKQKERVSKEQQKQKAKSEKDAEKRRQQMLESAKIQHQVEVRKKHEEERKRKKKAENQKKESEKAVEEWMDKRSQTWVEERKKEQKEKVSHQRTEKREKETAAKKGEEEYTRWREQKDNELKTSMRGNRLKQRLQKLSFEDEENTRPPWSPANKVIPRRR